MDVIEQNMSSCIRGIYLWPIVCNISRLFIVVVLLQWISLCKVYVGQMGYHAPFHLWVYLFIFQWKDSRTSPNCPPQGFSRRGPISDVVP